MEEEKIVGGVKMTKVGKLAGMWEEDRPDYIHRNGTTVVPSQKGETIRDRKKKIPIVDKDDPGGGKPPTDDSPSPVSLPVAPREDAADAQPVVATYVAPPPVADKKAQPEETEESVLEMLKLAPKAEVSFTFEDGGMIQCSYHAVVDATSVIVLVVDKRWKFSTMFYPAANDAKKIRLGVNGKEYVVGHLGIMFTYEHNVYTVLIKDNGK